MSRLLNADDGETLLDVGCGSGHFSRRFRQQGLQVTAIDMDREMLDFARARDGEPTFVSGDARYLPFKNRSFDHCIAVASLCFIPQPLKALEEMIRVARKSVVLGLLNRNSLLYWLKHRQGSYINARWDRRREIEQWAHDLGYSATIESAIFLPAGGPISPIVERLIPGRFPAGGFLAAKICRGR
ncbi:MAG: class I SAM-dependent methyltransferase [Mariprofundaceae bacterium]|nr:class I SAM-dependent methyltransferase [Mariprofundaceae bacterium]